MIFSLAITGPTASGKTALAIEIAKRLSGEIISADSMQIYKGMDIGTAKATEAEQSEVKHHLIDFLSPIESFSVERYREMAIEAVYDITGRGLLPIFAGGTGLYLDSLTRGVSLVAPESSDEFRESLLETVKTDEDKTALWQRLYEVDRESAEKIHKNNVKRVIRALEIYETTGKPKSLLDAETKNFSSEVFLGMITLDFHSRENLYNRVDSRVDAMIDEGLIDEVKRLYEAGLLVGTASQAIGYKELIGYIKGECTLDFAISDLKLKSRRYAKRQLTWFRHCEGAKRLFVDTESGKMKSKNQLIDEALVIARELKEEYERARS